MTDLIQIHQNKIDGLTQSTVNARELHSFLEVQSRFNDWIVNRIKQYGFIENQDYLTFTKKLVKGRPSNEYTLSLDMAKELSMVEGNEKGRQVRRYFIATERKLREIAQGGLQQLQNEEHRLLKEKVDRAIAIVGSQNKLAVEMDINGGNLSFMNTGKWHLLSAKMKQHIEAVCDRIIEKGGICKQCKQYEKTLKALQDLMKLHFKGKNSTFRNLANHIIHSSKNA